MEKVDITIIGAGVVGLSIAAELSGKYDNIAVLDKYSTFGQEISSRNSEVIHSGIYYPQASLKAKLCIEGNRRLYDICRKYNIPHKKTGKLIVATQPLELSALYDLFEKGKGNGVTGLTLLEKNRIEAIEPCVKAVAAIYAPDTGIIDSHSLMKHFYDFAKDKGVLFSYDSEVEFLDKEKDGFVVGIKRQNYRFKSKIVINSAGLSSDSIASLAGIDIDKCGYKLKFCKGSYFSYAGPSPVKMLVYPLPHDDLSGLGVHATLDLAGRLRFGPDVEYVDSIDYRVDINKREHFFRGAAKIISGIKEECFMPDQAGIRPKLCGKNDMARDFVIAEESRKGLPGLINLIGIESPGLTASAAIAGLVREMVKEAFD